MKISNLTTLSRLTVALLVLAVTLADTATSQAQRSRGRSSRRGDSLLELAQDREVRAELKLTDEQADSVGKIRGSVWGAESIAKYREFGPRIEAAKDDAERAKIEAERQTFLKTQGKAAETELAKIISSEQLRGLRLHQLKRRGMRGIGEEWVVAELKLTDEQKTKLQATMTGHDQQKKALDEARAALFRNRELPREERETKSKALETQREQLSQQRDQAILGLLTAEQKTSFQTLAGLPAADEGKPEASKTAATTPQPATTPTTPKTVASPADRGATVIGADGKPVAETVVASFGAAATAEGSKPAKSLKFNFVQAPWSDVLKMFAAAAGLTWDLETVPPGTFTYFDDKDYTPTEALNVLNGALLQKGFILLRRDRFAVVVNVDNPVPPNLVPTVSIADLPERASNELVRVVMPLEEKDAAKAATEVAYLLGPQGKAVALSVANSLIVTGLAKNVSEIYEVLKGYIPEEEKELTYEAFVLENVSALSAEKMVRDLFGLQARGVGNVSQAASASSSSRGSSRGSSDPRSRFGGSSRGGSSRESSSRDPRRQQSSSRTTASAGASVSLTVDERTNMLLAMAPPTKMEVIRKAIETIDVPTTGGPNRFADQAASTEPFLEVYKINSADTVEVTKTLNVLYPGAVVNEDGRFRTIHVMANKVGHEEIARMIRKLDGQGGTQTTAIIPIHQDPVTLTATLQGLYAKDIENAPSVIANPGYLVVRGNTEQIAEIRQMVTQLDSAIGGSLATGGGPIRSIPLGGRDVNSLLRMLQSVTPNPIRISVPSSGGGPIREQRVPSADDPSVRPESGATGGGAGGAAAGADRGPANFSVPPLRQAGNGSGNGAERSQNAEEAPEPPAVDETARHRRLATFVFQNLDADKDGQLTAEEWSASKRTRALFESRKVSLKLPADKAAFIKSFARLAQPEDEDPTDDTRPAAEESPRAAPATEPRPPLRRGAEREPEPEAGGKADLPEIIIEVRDGNLVLISEDEEALDQLEARLQSLMAHMSPKTTWTIFYLRSADATEAALMIERLFPQSSVSATASSSGGSLFGELTGGISSLGSSLMDMTGINSLQSGPTALRIIPETRSNALFVSGPADQVADVESVLKILDAAELPAQLRTRAPRYIEVHHADVNEIAQIVRDVYKEELSSSGRSSGGGNPMQGNPFAMLMGGGGGSSRSRGSSSRGGGSRQGGGVKMTLGVDSRTSALVVSASDSLFKQVESLVTTLDEAAKDARRTVRIVTLENTNSSAIQQAVSALLPKTSVSTGGGSSRPTGFGPSSSRTSSGRSSSGRSSSAAGGDQAARIRQFMEMRARGQSSRGSTGRTGSSGRGSSGGSPFGGRTGSSGRGSSRGR